MLQAFYAVLVVGTVLAAALVTRYFLSRRREKASSIAESPDAANVGQPAEEPDLGGNIGSSESELQSAASADQPPDIGCTHEQDLTETFACNGFELQSSAPLEQTTDAEPPDGSNSRNPGSPIESFESAPFTEELHAARTDIDSTEAKLEPPLFGPYPPIQAEATGDDSQAADAEAESPETKLGIPLFAQHPSAVVQAEASGDESKAEFADTTSSEARLELPLFDPHQSVAVKAEATSQELQPVSDDTESTEARLEPPFFDLDLPALLEGEAITKHIATHTAPVVAVESESVATSETPSHEDLLIPDSETGEVVGLVPDPIQGPGELSVDVDLDHQRTAIEISSAAQSQIARRRRRPPRYSPPIRTVEAARSTRRERTAENEPIRGRSLLMYVRVVFGRRNQFRVSLLAERASDCPEEVQVNGPNGEETWSACQDEWYEDVIPSSLNVLLGEGGRWEGADGRLQWVLSGREIYVLAPNSTISGFIQTSGVVLFQDHLVLCTRRQQEAVQRALIEAGSGEVTPISDGNGVPDGWVLFNGVRPSVAIQHENEAGILNILRPIHDVTIAFLGGIRLGHSRWLNGHPPKIRISGISEGEIDVSLDSRRASVDAEGNYTTSGWDSDGRHTVFCGGVTQSYELANGMEDWEVFEAYSYSQSPRAGDPISICGPVVFSVSNEGAPFLVPSGSNCLVGAAPGEIVLIAESDEFRVSAFLAQTSFEVAWGLPANPLRCNRSTCRVRLIHPLTPGSMGNISRPQERRATLRWCQVILDSSRKGLRIDPDTEDVRKLWLEYKRKARQLWRQLR